jgi:hypothetical protein
VALYGAGTDAKLRGNLIGGGVCGEENEHLNFAVCQVLIAAAAVITPPWRIRDSGCDHDGFPMLASELGGMRQRLRVNQSQAKAVTARPADAWLNAIKRIYRFPSP